MSTLPVAQKNNSFGRNAENGRNARFEVVEEVPPKKKALNEELMNRFKALIEGVTDELMAGQEGVVDREACRADAITLLMAAGEQLAAPPEAPPDVSGVVVDMLREEQRMRENKGTAPAAGPEQIFTFLRV